MTAIAVPCELDSLGPHQNVDAGSIERGSKGVGMQRLAPLTVSFLMTASAIRGRQEGPWLKEIATLDGQVARCRDLTGAEVEIVGPTNLIGVDFTVGGAILLRPGGRQEDC